MLAPGSCLVIDKGRHRGSLNTFSELPSQQKLNSRFGEAAAPISFPKVKHHQLENGTMPRDARSIATLSLGKRIIPDIPPTHIMR